MPTTEKSSRDLYAPEGRIIAPIISYWEQNLAHDSYFSVAVWDAEKARVVTWEYGATAWQMDVAHPREITATPEVFRAAAETFRENITRSVEQNAQVKCYAIQKGDRVTVVRGRKIPKGTTGVVGWIGSDKWNKLRLGLDTPEGERIWIAANNVDVDADVIAERLADYDIPGLVDRSVEGLAQGRGWSMLRASGYARLNLKDAADWDTWSRLERAGLK